MTDWAAPEYAADRDALAERAHQARDSSAVQFLLDGLGVESVAELHRLVESARLIEGGRDVFTGKRFVQMHPLTGDSPVEVVFIAGRDEPLSARDEAFVADFARLCAKRWNREREVENDAR